MLLNLIRESSTEQSIKISGKKRGPQIKRYKHQLSQIPRNTLMSKWLHHLFLPKRQSLWYWMKLKHFGQYRNLLFCLCVPEQQHHSEAAFICSTQDAKRSLQWKSLWAHETWYANRILTGGCRAQALPCVWMTGESAAMCAGSKTGIQ